MTRERANEIFETAKALATVGPWSDQLDNAMTAEERAEIMARWRTCPAIAHLFPHCSPSKTAKSEQPDEPGKPAKLAHPTIFFGRMQSYIRYPLTGHWPEAISCDR